MGKPLTAATLGKGRNRIFFILEIFLYFSSFF